MSEIAGTYSLKNNPVLTAQSNNNHKTSQVDSSTTETDCNFTYIPRDLINIIFSYLVNNQDQRALMQVNTKFREVYKSYFLSCFRNFFSIVTAELQVKNSQVFKEDIEYLTNFIKNLTYENCLKLLKDKNFEIKFHEIFLNVLPSEKIEKVLKKYQHIIFFKRASFISEIYLEFYEVYSKFSDYFVYAGLKEEDVEKNGKRFLDSIFESRATLLKNIIKEYDVVIKIIKNIKIDFYKKELLIFLVAYLSTCKRQQYFFTEKDRCIFLEKFISEEELWDDVRFYINHLDLIAIYKREGNFDKVVDLLSKIKNSSLNLPADIRRAFKHKRRRENGKIIAKYYKDGNYKKVKEVCLKVGYVLKGDCLYEGNEIIYVMED